MPINADLLLDTSAAIALVLPSHEHHETVLSATTGKTLGLSGHAAFETYSVLTRLPGGQRQTAAAAARLISANFPASHSLEVGSTRVVIERLVVAGISGAAVYDALVALAAIDAVIPLLSCDRRAQATYARLGTHVEIV